jgi:hypothetical protein
MCFKKHAPDYLLELSTRGDRNISGILGDLGASTGMFATVFDMSYYSGQRRARSLELGLLTVKTVHHWVAGKIAEIAEIQHRIFLGSSPGAVMTRLADVGAQ